METNGTETPFVAEECIEQLRLCNSALQIPSEVSIHLDRSTHYPRRHHSEAKNTTPLSLLVSILLSNCI